MNSKKKITPVTLNYAGEIVGLTPDTSFASGLSDLACDDEVEKDPEVDTEEKDDIAEASEEGTKTTSWIRYIVFFISFVTGIVLCFMDLGDDPKISKTLACALWIATLWLTELIPLVVTSFMPLFLFPMFGIVNSSTVAGAYMNDTIFLFLAGMLMALTLERWDLHRRFAFKTLSWCGSKPGALLFGMMFATFVLSMFVSNTATALMMVPNAIPVIDCLENQASAENKEHARKFGIAVMLGIAYAANIGGIASLIGTPPNLVFQAQLKIIYPDAPEIAFVDWLSFGLPFGLAVFIIEWIYLKMLYLRGYNSAVEDKDIFIRKYQELGQWTFEQAYVAALFVLLALLWIFRQDMTFGSFTLKGWTSLFASGNMISDATIGMLISVILFITPAKPCNLPGAPSDATDKRTTTVLDWTTAKKLPYDIIFLFGGGFALAKGFVASGLSTWLGQQLVVDGISLPAQVFLVTFVIEWVTCLTSNTATSNIMIPIAAEMANAAQVSPYTIMIPVTFACSCAFCLPVATPPNMVAFASGRLPVREMFKAGIFLNVLCSILILGWTFSLIPAVLEVEPDEFPVWAQSVVAAHAG